MLIYDQWFQDFLNNAFEVDEFGVLLVEQLFYVNWGSGVQS